VPDEALSAIVESLDPPLIVVTTAIGTERAGCLAGFHAQSSIDPPRYTIWLSKANHTYRVALRADYLAVHFLTAADLPLAERFGTLSGDTTDKFAGLAAASDLGGTPILLDCPHRLLGRKVAMLDEGGDHVCVVTETVRADSGGAFEPLRLSRAAHLQPGHESQERHGPPTERAEPQPESRI